PPPCSTLSASTPLFYPLSLHDALPIYRGRGLPPGELRRGVQLPDHPLPAGLPRLCGEGPHLAQARRGLCVLGGAPHLHRLRQPGDRKSTRLNSSHVSISYAVFCLKKKK